MAFLVTFTSKHDIWEMPTWQVQRDVIKPATAKTECRFTELEGSDVGPSDVFIPVGRSNRSRCTYACSTLSSSHTDNSTRGELCGEISLPR